MTQNYDCKLCNYSTTVKSNYKKHIKTKKHLSKIPSVICMFCKGTFKNASGLTRHAKHCIGEVKKKIDDKAKKDKMSALHEIQLLKERNKALEIQLDDRERMLNDKDKMISDKDKMITQITYMYDQVTSFTQKNTSTYNMISNVYNNNPPIQIANAAKFCDQMEESVEVLLDTIESHYNHNTLDSYIGDAIVKEYKKNDNHKQSLFNSDTSRLTYIIRECVSEINCWSFDKKGIKTKEYIITPVLTGLKKILTMSQSGLGKKLSDVDPYSGEFEEVIESMKIRTKIVIMIDDKILENKIIKYIGPYFVHDDKPLIKHAIVDMDVD